MQSSSTQTAELAGLGRSECLKLTTSEEESGRRDAGPNPERGVFAEATGDRFALTEIGQYLRSEGPDSVQPRAVFNTEVLLPLWGEFQ